MQDDRAVVDARDERRPGRGAGTANGHEGTQRELVGRLAPAARVHHRAHTTVIEGPPPVALTARAAVGGGAAIGAVYALARRAGLTRVDLAARIAPGRPLAGRLAQLGAGTLACLPSALVARPLPGAVLGLAAGAVAARSQPGRRDRVVALAAHAAGGVVAATWARRRPSTG